MSTFIPEILFNLHEKETVKQVSILSDPEPFDFCQNMCNNTLSVK